MNTQKDQNKDKIMELMGTLRQLRKDDKISQRELASRSLATQKTISLLENGGLTPTLNTILSISEALGYDIEFKFTKKEDDKNEVS